MNKSPGGCPGSTEGEENPALQFLSKLLVCSWWVFVELHSHLGDLARLAAEWLNSSEWLNTPCQFTAHSHLCSKPLHQLFSRGIRTREEELSMGKVSIITTFCFSSLVLSDSFWEASMRAGADAEAVGFLDRFSLPTSQNRLSNYPRI